MAIYETVENPARRLFKWMAVACLWIAGLFVVLATLRGIDQIGLSDRCVATTAEAQQASAELQDAQDAAAEAARDAGRDSLAASLAAALVDTSTADTLRLDAARQCAAADANKARAGGSWGTPVEACSLRAYSGRCGTPATPIAPEARLHRHRRAIIERGPRGYPHEESPNSWPFGSDGRPILGPIRDPRCLPRSGLKC